MEAFIRRSEKENKKISDEWKSLIFEKRAPWETHQWNKTSGSRSEFTRRIQIKKKITYPSTYKNRSHESPCIRSLPSKYFFKKIKKRLDSNRSRILNIKNRRLKPEILPITWCSMMMKTRSENSITHLQTKSERISGF